MLSLLLSLLGVGGIAGGLLNFFGPVAIRGFAGPLLSGVWDFLKSIPWQAYAIAAVAGVLAFLVISRGHAIERYRADESREQLVCQAVRDVAGRPHQDCRLNAEQIRAFGKSISDLEGTIGEQNRKIREFGRKTAQLQAEAAAAKREAAKQAGEAEDVRDQLKLAARSAASHRAPGDHCQSIKAVEDQWR